MGLLPIALFKESTSWQDYVNKVLMDSGFVSKAAIYSVKDQTCWASSANFSLDSWQLKEVINTFKDSTKSRIHGLAIKNRIFTITRINDNRILMSRETRTGHGCIIYRCNKCVIIAVYETGNHPGSCYTTVVKMGDYLYENGY